VKEVMTVRDEATEVKSAAEEGVDLPEVLSIMPLKEAIVFPFTMVPLVVKRDSYIKMADESLEGNKIIGLVPEGEDSTELVGAIGTAVSIYKMLRFPDNTMRLLVQGIARVRIREIVTREPFLKASVEIVAGAEGKDVETQALMKSVVDDFQRLVDQASYLSEELKVVALNIEEPGKLADMIASNLNIEVGEKREVLRKIDTRARLEMVSSVIGRELELIELGKKIQAEVKTEMDKSQREYYLRKQLEAIRRELGETDDTGVEIDELREKIEKAGMSEDARVAAEKELERLSRIPPAAAEYTVSRTYLDWLVSLPWKEDDAEDADIGEAERILDEDHYDLEKVKERILEYLSVRKLKKDMKGPILCFVGPPGVGKTSIGQSIARATKRKFYRMSLGGMRDEAEIRGHRRTYVGAMPGRIIQGLSKLGSKHSVFMLDEVDKLGADFRGDPASALLEVLDPSQNKEFSDHYLHVTFDLSRVMFITTANILDPIPPALRDRMEVLELPGYTNEEKLMIAKRYLVPRQLEDNGLTAERLTFADDAIKQIISGYTMEAGVRNLEREIASVCRKVATRVAKGNESDVTVTDQNVSEFLGARKVFTDIASRNDEVGVVTGLAWTQSGGVILFVEARKMAGGRGLILTGHLGNVMKESAQAAMSFVRSMADEMGIAEDFFSKNDVHIHVPSGAIPKDGPSAGVAMVTALASLACNRPVRHDVAMTGEITLSGKVLPVGGIRQKVLAGHRAGLTTIILPAPNEKDLEEVPEDIRREVNFIFVERIEQVLNSALLLPPEVEVPKVPAAPEAEKAPAAASRGEPGPGNKGKSQGRRKEA
jgi:ATP-dependent Lon protease